MHIDPYTVMPTSSNKIEEYLEKKVGYALRIAKQISRGVGHADVDVINSTFCIPFSPIPY